MLTITYGLYKIEIESNIYKHKIGGNFMRTTRQKTSNIKLDNIYVGAPFAGNTRKTDTTVPTRDKDGITLIALVITIILLLILAGVVLNLALGQKGIINNAEVAGKETNKETAIERINLKITTAQMNKYAGEQRMPTLQELADSFCEDKEIEYVELASKKVGSLDKIELGEKTSFFTKLKEYPYEFEINSSLQLASIDGIKIATENNNNANEYSLQEIKTNEIWMGKPIYRKVIYIESLPNATAGQYNHGIKNIDTIWINTGKSFIVWNTGYNGPLPHVHVNGTGVQISFTVDQNVIRIHSGTMDRTGLSAYVTVEYTKTTDNIS